ncbi:unnamed protein product [Prorocentrum cordatum]|uniref:Uncharacterized protein n=1 Tax=Prorocentrum cordatum TaxID=2364126 RepID=A0ABN9PIM4_9DINO|nr:unnamed protein product [Polarella glacialis]
MPMSTKFRSSDSHTDGALVRDNCDSSSPSCARTPARARARAGHNADAEKRAVPMAFPGRPRRLTLLAAALLLCPPARARAAQGGRGSALVRREVLAVDSRGQLSGGAAQGGTTAGLEEKQAEPDRRAAYRERFVEIGREAEEWADLQATAGALGGSMQRAGGEEGAGNEEGPPSRPRPRCSRG